MKVSLAGGRSSQANAVFNFPLTEQFPFSLVSTKGKHSVAGSRRWLQAAKA
jgi:hypothetical protein